MHFADLIHQTDRRTYKMMEKIPRCQNSSKIQ